VNLLVTILAAGAVGFLLNLFRLLLWGSLPFCEIAPGDENLPLRLQRVRVAKKLVGGPIEFIRRDQIWGALSMFVLLATLAWFVAKWVRFPL
jgi:hypothetical protein